MDKFLKRKVDSDVEKPELKKQNFSRKFDERYLNFGFTEFSDGRPQCVICYQVLSFEANRPNKLKRHLQTKHPEHEHKDADFFRQRQAECHKQKTTMSKATLTSDNALRASYATAYRIAKTKKPHTIAEELVLPAAIEMCEIMVNASAANKLKLIPLSNDTVSRRIQDMAEDVKNQLVGRLSKTKFSIQLDESTDNASCAQLLVYVRYSWEGDVIEDFLFCRSIPGRTTGEDIFRELNDFFEAEGLSWQQCIAVCTDGAAAMTGSKSGVVARIKKVAPNVQSIHCMIHRQALASKRLSPDLHDVMNLVVKVVNFIKSRPLNSRLFSRLCNDMDADHTSLLFHSEVRWLSRGRVLERVYNLRNEIKEFLVVHEHGAEAEFQDPLWIGKLAYLTDIFTLLNGLNLSLQGNKLQKYANYYESNRHLIILNFNSANLEIMKKTSYMQ